MHLKGDTNATADKAHVVTGIDQGFMTVVLDTLHHHWFLPRPVLNTRLEASGPKRGQGSIFNEYMASYEHDWEDAVFEEQYHREGYREPLRNRSHDYCHDDELDF